TAYGLANGKQSLSEVAPRLLLAGATPEKCGQLIARVSLARPRGQVREECLGLRRHNKRWATVRPRLEAAQERKREPPHLSPSVAPTLVPVLGTNQETAEVGSRALTKIQRSQRRLGNATTSRRGCRDSRRLVS